MFYQIATGALSGSYLCSLFGMKMRRSGRFGAMLAALLKKGAPKAA
ncbi:hypothetical protein [Pelagibacterium sediminicola]|nr:hypothetical protein [Pelagibacterium sediminicola]